MIIDPKIILLLMIEASTAIARLKNSFSLRRDLGDTTRRIPKISTMIVANKKSISISSPGIDL